MGLGNSETSSQEGRNLSWVPAKVDKLYQVLLQSKFRLAPHCFHISGSLAIAVSVSELPGVTTLGLKRGRQLQ